MTALLFQSDRFAAGLTALGLEKGDRVGILAPNCVEWIIVQYAAARAGFILVSPATHRRKTLTLTQLRRVDHSSVRCSNFVADHLCYIKRR